MPVRPGARLGPYEILGLIGAGGMGEVYKARDTRLDRTVALKVLPVELSADPERRQRFEREAKTISALNHPHICTLHDVGDQDGTAFLVMEHLEGETLAERLRRGALPLSQALDCATQVADALAAAHKQGVIHRDLKPGNVMLTKTGAKLLDFGLAKLKGHWEQPAAAHLASAPTQSTPLTAEGTIAGTLQYMAPEQLEGKPADARTDLWALGAILHEMLTGKRAFEGTSAASLITAIMSAEPPVIAALQPLTPPAVDRLVRKCLAKAADERWDTAHDVADELRWIAEERHAAHGSPESGPPQDKTTAHRQPWARVLGVVGLVAGLMLVAWLLSPARRGADTRESSPTHFITDVRPADSFGYWQAMAPGSSTTMRSTTRPSRTALTLSPDGRFLVFVGLAGKRQQLYLREWDRAEASPIAGTDGADSPFFSPNGKWIGFWTAGEFRKVPVEGGQAVTICATGTPPYGASWGTDNRIVYARSHQGPLWSVSADGGDASPLAALDASAGEVSHRLPQVLPGARWVLFTVFRGSVIDWQRAQVVAQSLDTGERKVLVEGAADGRYIPTGHLVFGRGGSLLAVPFDVERLAVRGEPVTVIGSVMQSVGTGDTVLETGATQLAVSNTGTLVYVTGGLIPWLGADSAMAARRLVWVSRDGTVEPLPAPLRPYLNPRLSPDGRQVAVGTQESPRMVWVYDITRQTLTRATTAEGHARNPLWTPDGQRLTFSLEVNGATSLVWMPADGSTPPARLAAATGTMALTPASWSPDGRSLVSLKLRPDADNDIEVLTVDGTDVKSRRLLDDSRFVRSWPALSPDGRWLAYVSDESGRGEVYAQRFPELGAKRQVSSDGGIAPAWSHDGRELFYLRPAGATGVQLMSVETRLGVALSLGSTRTLFELDRRRYFLTQPTTPYDVTEDNRRFLFVQLPETLAEPPVREIHVVFNWFEELKAKVPTR